MSGTVYDTIGQKYSDRRRADPRIAASILKALGDAKSVINIGAGTGSYEPNDRAVLAIEPSEVMISQRHQASAICVTAAAESLPVSDKSFDAAMAILTIHHWKEWKSGLREMRRVAKKKIVLLTFDAEQTAFWLVREYFPDIATHDQQAHPPTSEMAAMIEANKIQPILVPYDCSDGFLGAYWRRPAAYLDPDIRRSISSFSRIDPSKGLERLRVDLNSGRWEREHAALMNLEEIDLGYRLICADQD